MVVRNPYLISSEARVNSSLLDRLSIMHSSPSQSVGSGFPLVETA
ncbi:Uncharacterised protein [Vibrio cholerae]|nr:Uncharacterised protein [Vibrio cholerae]